MENTKNYIYISSATQLIADNFGEYVVAGSAARLGVGNYTVASASSRG